MNATQKIQKDAGKADATPLYAAVGLTDTVVERARETVNETVAKAGKIGKALTPQAISKVVTMRATEVTKKAEALPGDARSNVTEGLGKVQDGYQELAERGHGLVERVKNQKATKDLTKQVTTVVEQGRQLLGTASKGVTDTRSAAKATVTQSRREAADVVADVVAGEDVTVAKKPAARKAVTKAESKKSVSKAAATKGASAKSTTTAAPKAKSTKAASKAKSTKAASKSTSTKSTTKAAPTASATKSTATKSTATKSTASKAAPKATTTKSTATKAAPKATTTKSTASTSTTTAAPKETSTSGTTTTPKATSGTTGPVAPAAKRTVTTARNATAKTVDAAQDVVTETAKATDKAVDAATATANKVGD